MSKCPIPCLESSPTSSHLSKPCIRKYHFQNKTYCSRKYTTEFRLKYGTILRGECVGELLEIVMVLIRNDLLDRLPTPFSRKSSCEIPFATMFVFQKIHVMHSHLISRLPGAYENTLCHFNHFFIPIYQICIYSQIAFTPHVIQYGSTNTQICSLELFNIHQTSPKLAHLSNSQSHLQWPTQTIIFHIIEQITISSPKAYTHDYIPYNCDIMLTHRAYALTY